MKRRTFVTSAGAAAAVAAAGCASTQTGSAKGGSVATPSIQGPVPVVAGSNEPFRGTNEQPVAGPGLPPPILIPFGYVEEEYFVSGTANGQPYATSLLVRKPSNPARFSGLVAVETIHASGPIPLWGPGGTSWMPGGHAWVAVASQRVALETHLRRANAARYKSLSIPDLGGDAQAPSATAANPQDLYSQAIMTQVGALLKSGSRVGPLQGLDVRYLVMGGASQTGGTTLRYIENSHAGARLASGQPVYDGYLPMESFSANPVPAIDAAVLHICVEGDLMNALAPGRPVGARPDSNTRTNRYVHYELTGASHVGTRPQPGATRQMNAPGGPPSQFPNADYFSACVVNLVDWLMQGVAPPTTARITVANGQIQRDQYGNALGGLRSPYVDTPTVRYIPSEPLAEGADAQARRQRGVQYPIPAEQLRKLYSSRAEYLRRFNEGIDRNVAGRWLRRADGERLKQEEVSNPVLAALT